MSYTASLAVKLVQTFSAKEGAGSRRSENAVTICRRFLTVYLRWAILYCSKYNICISAGRSSP
jgi:hypothetical protein